VREEVSKYPPEERQTLHFVDNCGKPRCPCKVGGVGHPAGVADWTLESIRKVETPDSGFSTSRNGSLLY
jgi:hypothetical protein